MSTIRITILSKKERVVESNMVKQIKRIFMAAANMVNKHIDIVESYNLKEFQNIISNNSQTPIIIINDVCEFTGAVPTVDLVRQRLLASDGPSPSM